MDYNLHRPSELLTVTRCDASGGGRASTELFSEQTLTNSLLLSTLTQSCVSQHTVQSVGAAALRGRAAFQGKSKCLSPTVSRVNIFVLNSLFVRTSVLGCVVHCALSVDCAAPADCNLSEPQPSLGMSSREPRFCTAVPLLEGPNLGSCCSGSSRGRHVEGFSHPGPV